MRGFLRDFWAWYERHYAVNVAVAAGLFGLQLVHLVWLTGDPLADRVLGEPLFELEGLLEWPVLLVDYTEVPALVSVSLLYLNELRRGFAWMPVLYLLFLNSQWLHIFWITDEFVLAAGEGDTALPPWLAYVALAIDYLELPVIWDTIRRVVANARLVR